MSNLIFTAVFNFLGVFVGLVALWSVTRLMTPRQRAINAAFAGVFSAVATFIVGTIVAIA